MGGNRSNKRERAVTASRPRTRGTNPKLADPVTNTNNLNACLKAQGLYAANTVGDGNCLFRALSDQLWGSQANHLVLRQMIVDFIRKHKDEYAGFIEDERGIDVHLENMAKPGTYGGHVELSVFSRMMRLNVKVIQPDVSFMIEHKNMSAHDDEVEPSPTTGSPKRRKSLQTSFPRTEGTIYVAYHDWEHFSSVRNIKGPHHGLPKVQELPEEEQENVRPARSTTISKHKLKAMRGKVPIPTILKPSPTVPSTAPVPSSKSPAPSPHKASSIAPEPESRGSSPLTSVSQASSSSAIASVSHSISGSGSSAPSSLAPVTPPDGQDTSGRSGLDARLRSRLGVERNAHSSRSPKRSFGDSDLEADGERDGSVEGRRVRRKPTSNTSNLSSASPGSNLAPPPSSPDAPSVVDEDAEGEDDDDDHDEDMSVLKLLADPTADEASSSDSSLSPPPPEPKELEAARRRMGGSQFLHPYSQVSMGTTPPSSVPPSSRPSPAPFEGSSQDTTSAFDEESQRTSGSTTAARLTRRQRRSMGLPKHGNGSGRATPNSGAAVGTNGNGNGNGNSNVIVIPGGRHPSRLAMKAAQERQRLDAASDHQTAVFEEDGETFQHEWEKSGAGRKDSRGFVILNI